MFRKMPFVLLAIFFLLALFYPLLTTEVKSVMLGVSLSLKSLILFLLPLLVFALLFKAALELSKTGSKAILVLLMAICLSNFTSTMVSYLVGTFAYQGDLSLTLPTEGIGLAPLGAIELPKWIGNGQALFLGSLSGFLCGKLWPDLGEKISSSLEKVSSFLLRVFLYIIPLFIAGFAVKMIHEGQILEILFSYGKIFALVAGAVFSYIGLIYWIANRFQWNSFFSSIKNMVPAAVVGFGSMSSAAAMPLTILGTEKNSNDLGLARSIIPATANIHLIGDCFAIPIFAFAIMKSFGIPEPSFFSYLIFALYFVLAKFSVAAVPGGGILVMLPILEAYLGFGGEMLSLITTLYILFDPLITSANIFGNGGFALAIGRFLSKTKLS